MWGFFFFFFFLLVCLFVCLLCFVVVVVVVFSSRGWISCRLRTSWDLRTLRYIFLLLPFASCGWIAVVVVAYWLLYISAREWCQCISGTGMFRQVYVLPHWDSSCRSNFLSNPVTSGRLVQELTQNTRRHWITKCYVTGMTRPTNRSTPKARIEPESAVFELDALTLSTRSECNWGTFYVSRNLACHLLPVVWVTETSTTKNASFGICSKGMYI